MKNWLCAVMLLLGGIAASAADKLPAQWRGADPPATSTFRFVVMSDNNSGSLPGEWEAAIREVNLLHPDFVMSVGDLIPGYSEEPAEVVKMWQEFDAKNHLLRAPFFYVVGNHDISNAKMRSLWLERYGMKGHSYYSFNYGGCHFVALDSATPLFDKTFMQQQMEWLRQDIELAGKAKHIFVFFHHPTWAGQDNAGMWQEMVKILPAGRTTVFNGHWHDQNYVRQDNIDNFVLAATGTEYDQTNRELGIYRLYAQVTVRDGKPTVALVPVHAVEPGEFVSYEWKDKFFRTIEAKVEPGVPTEGGPITLYYRNVLNAPLQVQVRWNAPGWRVQPAESKISVAPGTAAELKYEATRLDNNAPLPGYTARYLTLNPEGRTVTPGHAITTKVPLRLAARRQAGLKIDGRLDDWEGVPGFSLGSKQNLFGGKSAWNDAGDLSGVLRLAHDSEKLYVAMDITDDDLQADGPTNWETDALEMYWDSRPRDQQNGGHGTGTGQAIIPLPGLGKPLQVEWLVGKQKTPQGLECVMQRRPGGYVCELSIPLNQLGMPAAAAGQSLRMEFHLDDRDLRQGAAVHKYMNVSGTGGSYERTGHYSYVVLQ